MNEITNNIFNVPEKLEPVETATILGKEFVIYGTVQDPWFKAKDVAEWIEYDASSINKLINSVDEDEKARHIMATLKGDQEVWFLSENGVYEVLMQSRKPIAKEFDLYQYYADFYYRALYIELNDHCRLEAIDWATCLAQTTKLDLIENNIDTKVMNTLMISLSKIIEIANNKLIREIE